MKGSAVTVKVDNILYTVDLETNEAEVDGAYSYSSLTDLVIPDYIDYKGSQIPVTSIGDYAFYNCSNLNSLTIGDNVQTIGKYAFMTCIGFTGSLTIPESVQTIGDGAFYLCSGFTGSLTIPNSVQTIGDGAFYLCSGFTGSLTIPNSVQTIGSNAFFQCTGFTGSLTIGDNVQTIGKYAFYLCSGFTGSLTIGESVQTIGDNAFQNCSGFTGELIIPESVKEIGSTCFDGCNNISSLVISSSATKIYYQAFSSCNGLKTITCLGVTPPECIYSGSYNYVFNTNICNNTPLYVPAESVNLYKNATEWKKFKYINPIQIEATDISLNKTELSLLVGQEETLVATLTPEDAKTEIVWSVENGGENIVTVSQDGNVSALSVGSATITAKAGEVSAICKVTVNPVTASDVNLNVQNMTLTVGQTGQLKATVNPPNTTDQTISWKSNNEAVATVGSDGTVTAVSVGTANITATCGDASATCKVTVNPVLASGITLNIEDMTLTVGQTDKLTATVTPPNTTVQTITWTSDNTAVATVSADGTVTAVAVGVANITATCRTLTASCKVTVNPVPVTSIELSLQNVTILIGSKTTLTAKVYPGNATNQDITWSSGNPSIASIDSNGTITAIQVGETTVTATCGTVSASCKVTVASNVVEPTEIILNIKDMVLYIGQSETIQAIVRPPNTTNSTVSWRSDNEAVATVSADGKVVGISEGIATITASCGEVSATCKVTVNPIPASNIEITTGDVTLTIGSTTVLKAKVSPDNTTHPEVEWQSSDPGIASISADGTVTAKNIGTAIITAKCGNVSATCKVTVIPVPSEGIVISPTSVSMLLGDYVTLAASVYPENTTDKNITWGSDNPAVASVSSSGVVTALSVGTATITASNGSAKATCAVTVNPVVATSISLNVKDETIFVASTTQLVATISPANVTDKTITWTSSRPEIATVDDRGLVYGVSVGTTTITAKIGDVSTTCQINVVHRIPDMDPSVTTSDRDIKTMSGMPVNMAVYAEGGEPTGWSYVWTRNGEVVSQSSELNIIAKNETETVIAETYRVKVENEIDKVVILSEVFDFVVQVYPAISGFPGDGGDGNDNGITISTGNGTGNKTREGNTVTLSVATPKGGNPQGWEYMWSANDYEIGEGETIETVATMSDGFSMAVEECRYEVELTNYSPDGDIWGQFSAASTLDVYRRPETPLQMLRKGDGTSHMFIAMMPLSDTQLSDYNYEFVYGYTDAQGRFNILEETSLRYCQTDAEIYWNPENRFWVYSVWHYADGSSVTSGLRYLDGSADEDFDASNFYGVGIDNTTGRGGESTAIYTLDGQYMGTDRDRLVPGIYILHTVNGGVSKAEKFIVR